MRASSASRSGPSPATTQTGGRRPGVRVRCPGRRQGRGVEQRVEALLRREPGDGDHEPTAASPSPEGARRARGGRVAGDRAPVRRGGAGTSARSARGRPAAAGAVHEVAGDAEDDVGAAGHDPLEDGRAPRRTARPPTGRLCRVTTTRGRRCGGRARTARTASAPARSPCACTTSAPRASARSRRTAAASPARGRSAISTAANPTRAAGRGDVGGERRPGRRPGRPSPDRPAQARRAPRRAGRRAARPRRRSSRGPAGRAPVAARRPVGRLSGGRAAGRPAGGARSGTVSRSASEGSARVAERVGPSASVGRPRSVGRVVVGPARRSRSAPRSSAPAATATSAAASTAPAAPDAEGARDAAAERVERPRR